MDTEKEINDLKAENKRLWDVIRQLDERIDLLRRNLIEVGQKFDEISKIK
jgi:prefoldin subunit 5